MNKQNQIYHNKTIDDDCEDECEDDSDEEDFNQIKDKTDSQSDKLYSDNSSSCSEYDQLPYITTEDNKEIISKSINYNKINDSEIKLNYNDFFSSKSEINYHYKNFNDFKDAFIVDMKYEINYIQSKIFDIYGKFNQIIENNENNDNNDNNDVNGNNHKVPCYEDKDAEKVSKEMKLDSRSQDEIVKLMYLFTLVQFNIISKYLDNFISHPKNYDRIREKYVNEIVNERISANFINLKSLNSIISKNSTTNKINNYNNIKNSKKEDNIKCSKYYYTIYSSGLHSHFASLFKTPSSLFNSVSKSNSTCCGSVNTEKLLSLKEKFKKSEIDFINSLKMEECEAILEDIYSAYELMSRTLEASLNIFDNLITLYQKHCSIQIEDISVVFIYEIIRKINEDPFYKVSI